MLRKLEMPIHGFTFALNHFHLLASPKDADHLACFMRRVEQKLSTQIRLLYDWEGTLWQDRYHAIPIENDEHTQVSGEEARRAFVQAMVAELEAEVAERQRKNGTRPVGVRKILAHHPWERPRTAKRSSRPFFYAATKQGWLLMRQAYQLFVAVYRAAAERLKAGATGVRFPEGSFPPAASFVG